MKRKVFVRWETDGEEIENLPEEMELPEELSDASDDEITNWLSDQTGWLVIGWNYEEEEEQEPDPEFVGQLVDVFEDFLEKHKDELDTSEGVILAGSKYDELSAGLSEVSRRWLSACDGVLADSNRKEKEEK